MYKKKYPNSYNPYRNVFSKNREGMGGFFKDILSFGSM